MKTGEELLNTELGRKLLVTNQVSIIIVSVLEHNRAGYWALEHNIIVKKKNIIHMSLLCGKGSILVLSILYSQGTL